jgi:naphthalene 1,2-dioxygenase system ferredoxin subunit
MNTPERPEDSNGSAASSAHETWVDVCSGGDLFEGASIAAQVGGREIALHCVHGVPYATDNACTHGAARLCEGFLDGFDIECPLHQGRFDIRSGKAMCAPLTAGIRVHASRIDGGRVLVRINPAEASA